MITSDEIGKWPIKEAVASYRAGDLETCLAHYQDAIRCYPDLAPGLRATVDLMRRMRHRERPGSLLDANPGLAIAQARSPLASVFHSMGIEQLYVVNLDRRPDRMCRVLREMSAQGLKVTRVTAVDACGSIRARDLMEKFRRRASGSQGWVPSHVSVQDVEHWKGALAPGVFGYLLSQAAVLEDASRNGYQRIAVFDDDVFFTSDAPVRLRKAVAQLPANWAILLLGASEYADRASKEFAQARVGGCTGLYHPIPGKTCGSFAVVYDRSVYDELLLAIEAAEAPYDNFALGTSYARHRQQCFVIDPAVCVPDVSESDIRDRPRAQQVHSRRMRWELARYGVFTAPMSIAVITDASAALEGSEPLEQQLPGNGVLCIHRRPANVIRGAGQPLIPAAPGQAPMAANPDERQGHHLRGLCMPQADIVVFWPCGRPVDAQAVQELLAKALERANSGLGLEGIIDGIAYRLDAPLAPW